MNGLPSRIGGNSRMVLLRINAFAPVNFGFIQMLKEELRLAATR
jgi:hypothetical protein